MGILPNNFGSKPLRVFIVALRTPGRLDQTPFMIYVSEALGGAFYTCPPSI